VDTRSDIYSLGVVLFEMVAGRPPFLGESPVAVASKHVRDQAPALRDLNPTAPVAYEAIVARAMAKSVDARYQTAEDLRADLLRYVEGRPVLAEGAAVTSAMAAVGAGATTQMMGGGAATQAVGAATLGIEHPYQRQAQSRRRRTRALWITLAVLLVALAIIAFFLFRSVNSGGFALPNVVGEPVAAATQNLEGRGLVVTTIQETNAKPSGTVLSSDPSAGSTVKSGDTVKLGVSAGLQQVTVPNVVNQQLADAEAALQAAHLAFTTTTIPSSAPANTVLSQSPAGGTKAAPGSNVILTIPQVQQTAAVPNVVGQSPASAGAALGAANFSVNSITTTTCDPAQNGNVVSQSPTAGTQAPKNSTVTITVCNATTTTSPPTTAPTTTTTTAPPTTTTASTTTTSTAPSG
jgi:eukaryotic-like serine/threonine-protein kinase